MYLISLPHFFLFFFSTFLFFVGFILEGESERHPHTEIETQKYKDRTRKTNMVNKIFKIAEKLSKCKTVVPPPSVAQNFKKMFILFKSP